MSIFKRANWSSGLTYRQTCHECKTVVEYTDEVLDFRPWYPDGFVYCPTCNTPLRHNEKHAINAQNNDTAQNEASNETIEFCRKCGKKVNSDDVFCSKCGTKLR